MRKVTQGRNLQREVFGAGHGQQVGNLLSATGEPLILLDAQQHMGRSATIRDEDRAVLGSLLCLGHILVQFPAR